MCMHQCLRDTARKETDNDVPDKMKHDFWNIRSSCLEPCKSFIRHSDFLIPVAIRASRQREWRLFWWTVRLAFRIVGSTHFARYRWWKLARTRRPPNWVNC